jgi:hypothetical protein
MTAVVFTLLELVEPDEFEFKDVEPKGVEIKLEKSGIV